jgi:hypothetical protein
MFCHRVVISDDDVSVWHVLSLSLFLSFSLSLSLLVSIGNPTDGGGDGSNRVAGAKVACYTNTNYRGSNLLLDKLFLVPLKY